MADLHLMRPLCLLALLLLPPLAWWLRRQRAGQQFWQTLLPAHLQPAMLSDADASRPIGVLLPVGLLALAILALAGPSWDKQSVPLFQLQQGRVLVMDMSYSQWATDLKPNRLTQARFRALDLLKQLPDGELGLVAYAGDAFVLAPLTEDRTTLANLLPTLSPELMPVPGSNLPNALYTADQLLRDAGYQQGDIMLITDGLHPEHADEALALAAKLPWRLNILALGSAEGAPMGRPDGQLIRNRADEIALATTDFALLGKLARAGQGTLVPYRSDGSDLTRWIQAASPSLEAEGRTQEDRLHQQWQDRGAYLLLLLLLPLAWMLRRHALLALLPVLWLSGLSTSQVEASPWLTDDQQGQRAFERGNYAEAAQLFENPAWQGAALYRDGQYEQALTAFEQGGDIDSTFNAGNALMQLGRYDEAAERYQKVLDQQPQYPGARDNLDLARTLMENPPQQQSQNDKDGDSDDSSDGSGSDGQNAEDPSSEGQSQDPQSPSSQSDPGSQSGDAENGPEDAQPPSMQAGGDAESGQERPTQPPGSEPSDSDQSQGANSDAQAQSSADPNAPRPQPKEAAESEAGAQQGQEEDHSEGQNTEAQGTGADMSEPGQEEAEQAGVAAAETGDSPPEDPELTRMLRRVPDDPATLLRNKMQLEYQRRRQEGRIHTERTQW
ncbi:VWA domain-containing protein [Ferrimonas gelatinilytica]|uniref:VWA domain-containing protein n=1 Tax=Ferrimonas gelatinilytica TaxID=1255257 RepID=A0ABP9S612_9GAMM